jgi:type I restriction enzyme S subunit
MDILRKFYETVNIFMMKILVNMQENQKLTELRDWLLPMLMNGQIKIKDAEQDTASQRVAMAAEPEAMYKKSMV